MSDTMQDSFLPRQLIAEPLHREIGRLHARDRPYADLLSAAKAVRDVQRGASPTIVSDAMETMIDAIYAIESADVPSVADAAPTAQQRKENP